MILEMKVPSPGESITEVEIAAWLVQDGDYVEKDQAIAEVDSDKATLELPAEASGVITLKAEEGDAVAVGAVVCLIDTAAEKPAASSAEPTSEVASAPAPKAETPKTKAPKTETPKVAAATSYATGTPSPAAKKILAEKGMSAAGISGTGKDGRVTTEDAVKAIPSMGTAEGAVKLSTNLRTSEKENE
jgi:2-oxoglutarate dehydrogenase E2 component (dihydrolipoamide succinyltransferase)